MLSGGELILAALLQSQHPNIVASKYNPSREFGSKFVTVCVSGSDENLIELRAYQASNQALSLAKGAWFTVHIAKTQLCIQRTCFDQSGVNLNYWQ